MNTVCTVYRSLLHTIRLMFTKVNHKVLWVNDPLSKYVSKKVDNADVYGNRVAMKVTNALMLHNVRE